MANEINILFAFALIMAFFSALILLGMPEEFQLFDSFDLTILIVEIVGVAGTCTLATGIPCAVAFLIASSYNIFDFVIVSNDLIKLLIFMPIFVVLTYILSRLARG